ncbi:unnamed protein product [Calypogeia fissa]
MGPTECSTEYRLPCRRGRLDEKTTVKNDDMLRTEVDEEYRRQSCRSSRRTVQSTEILALTARSPLPVALSCRRSSAAARCCYTAAVCLPECPSARPPEGLRPGSTKIHSGPALGNRKRNTATVQDYKWCAHHWCN